MPNTEKQLTAMQSYIDELTLLKNKALAAIKLNGNKDMPTHIEDGLFAAYSNAIEQAKKKLTTERQQLIDFGESCINNVGVGFELEKQFDKTFKTQ